MSRKKSLLRYSPLELEELENALDFLPDFFGYEKGRVATRSYTYVVKAVVEMGKRVGVGFGLAIRETRERLLREEAINLIRKMLDDDAVRTDIGKALDRYEERTLKVKG